MRIAGAPDQAWVTIDLDRVAEAVALLRARRGDTPPPPPSEQPVEVGDR